MFMCFKGGPRQQKSICPVLDHGNARECTAKILQRPLNVVGSATKVQLRAVQLWLHQFQLTLGSTQVWCRQSNLEVFHLMLSLFCLSQETGCLFGAENNRSLKLQQKPIFCLFFVVTIG